MGMEHMTYHTGERQYQCNVCGKTFTVKIDLSAHIKLVHEKPTDSKGIPTSSDCSINFELDYPNTTISTCEDSSHVVIAENKNVNDEEQNSWQDHEKRKQLMDECGWINISNEQTKNDSNTHSSSFTYIPNVPKL